MANKKNDSLDACPFPPDGEPPSKTSTTNMLEAIDWFFDGWRNTAILLSLMSIVLAYSLVLTPFPLFTRSTMPDTWSHEFTADYPSFDVEYYVWMYQADPDEVYTDIVLEGDEVLEVVNTTFLLNGNILLKDNSKLILRNSRLVISNQSTGYNPEITVGYGYGNILLVGSSSMELDNSTILSVDHHYTVGAIEQSRVILDSSQLANGTLWLVDSTSIVADDSNIRSLSIKDDVKGVLTNTTLGELQNYNGWQSGPLDPRRHGEGSLLLKECAIDYLSLNFLGGSMSIETPTTGYHKVWNPYQDYEFDGYVFNVTLLDSTVHKWSSLFFLDGDCSVSGLTDRLFLSAINSSLNISDSTIEGVHLSSNASLYMINSVASSLSFAENNMLERDNRDLVGFDISTANIITSNIELIHFADETNILFDRVLLNNVYMTEKEVFVKGEIQYGEGLQYGNRAISEYDSFSYTQEYRVSTYGEERIVPAVSLVLIDGSGESVWEGITDENGEALFNITYCNYYPLNEPYKYVTNYKEEWTIVASKDETTTETKIKFRETGSPITLQFPEPSVLQRIKFTPLSIASLGLILVVLAVKIRKK